MGIFKRSKSERPSKRDKELAEVQARTVDLTTNDLANLLDTAGGGYVRPGPPALRDAAEAVFRRLPKDEKDSEGIWRGVARLRKEQDGKYDIVSVSVRGTMVSKLTKESVASIWAKFDGAIPVLCEFRLIGTGEYTKPSLHLLPFRSHKSWVSQETE